MTPNHHFYYTFYGKMHLSLQLEHSSSKHNEGRASHHGCTCGVMMTVMVATTTAQLGFTVGRHASKHVTYFKLI